MSPEEQRKAAEKAYRWAIISMVFSLISLAAMGFRLYILFRYGS